MKKRVAPAEARAILSKVPRQVSFWLCTNQEMRNLKELAKELTNITDDTFRYHVNRDKNDFELWIRDVVNDRELAREIARVKTKETLHRKIGERVVYLSSIVERVAVQKKPQIKAKPATRRTKKSKPAGLRKRKVKPKRKLKKHPKRKVRKPARPKKTRKRATNKRGSKRIRKPIKRPGKVSRRKATPSKRATKRPVRRSSKKNSAKRSSKQKSRSPKSKKRRL